MIMVIKMELESTFKSDGLFGRKVHFRVKGDELEVARSFGEMLKDKEIQAFLMRMFMSK